MRPVFLVVCLILSGMACAARADDTVTLKYSRAELEAKWRSRIQSLLDQGKLPKIDMESSATQEQAENTLPGSLAALDDLGIALMATDGYQRPKDGSKGYRWSDYVLDLVNRHPDRFIPTGNGGTNPNWVGQKTGANSYVEQMEARVRAGQFATMGEIEFRHYLSSSECAEQRDRENEVPMNSDVGRRIFALSAETGTVFSAHLEPEERALDGLEEMLAAYPKAKVIVAHFGQVRHPERAPRYSPDYVRKLLSTYPNLYFDLSTGGPNRKYKCAGPDNNGELIGDTVLWQSSGGRQTESVSPVWRAILEDYSDRFVFAADYGNGRPHIIEFMRERVANFDRIVRDVSDTAKQNIAYKNAWTLLTGKPW